MSLEKGSTVDLDVLSAKYKNIPLAFRDQSLNWSVSGGVATVDQNGKVTATNTGSGTLTISYGDYSTTVQLTVAENLISDSSNLVLADLNPALIYD